MVRADASRAVILRHQAGKGRSSWMTQPLPSGSSSVIQRPHGASSTETPSSGRSRFLSSESAPRWRPIGALTSQRSRQTACRPMRSRTRRGCRSERRSARRRGSRAATARRIRTGCCRSHGRATRPTRRSGAALSRSPRTPCRFKPCQASSLAPLTANVTRSTCTRERRPRSAAIGMVSSRPRVRCRR